MPTYRTNGAWGAGTGVRLTAAQVDNNFYDHETRIVSLETTPPTANSIETITASGFTWTVTLTDGTILDPLPVPVVYTVWRGDWQPFTLYSEADLFRVSDQGIFAVMQAHTSAATFDPDAAAGSPLAPLYLLMIGLSSLPADTTLDEISDVTITGVADNDFIAWDAGSSLWTNRTAADVAALLAALTALDDLSDVDATAPTLGQVLTWQGSPASWQPADVAATLDELTDVSVPAPGDGDVLTYQAGSPTGWIAAPVPDIPSALDDLTDVAAPAPADGDFLQYQSVSPAGWVNAAGTGISDLASVSLPLLSTDLILVSEGVGSPPSSYQTRKATVGDLGFTLGSTAIALGGTTTTVAGLTLSSPTLSGTVAGTYNIGGTPSLTVALALPGSGQITSVGEVGLLVTPPTALLHLGGTYTTANANLAIVGSTLSSSSTSALTGLLVGVTLTPTGASFGGAQGLYSLLTVDNTSLSVTNVNAVISEVKLGSTFSGVVSNLAVNQSRDVTVLGGSVTNVYQYSTAALTANNGLASGSALNIQFRSTGITAGSAGGALANEAYRVTVPSGGSSSGSTTNRGLRITSNGGTASGGTVTNHAIYNDSTANAYLSAGNVGIQVITPTIALDVGGRVRAKVYTVATLPTVGTAGARAAVSDATAPAWGVALVGGGAVNCGAYDTGAAWVAG